MKQVKYTALLSVLALLSTLNAFARDKNQHSVEIIDSIEVGGQQLAAGVYKVEWQGTGPDVKVNFVSHGKTVATATGTLKTDDPHVIQNAILTEASGANTQRLKEIDFSHNKESLVFEQSGM
jgi:hypothetical protein